MTKGGHEDKFLDVDASPAGIYITFRDEDSFVGIIIAGFQIEGGGGNDLAGLIGIGLEIIEGDGLVSGRDAVVLNVMLDIHAR